MTDPEALDLVQPNPAHQPTVNGVPVSRVEVVRLQRPLRYYSARIPSVEERRAIQDYLFRLESILDDRERLIDDVRD